MEINNKNKTKMQKWQFNVEMMAKNKTKKMSERTTKLLMLQHGRWDMGHSQNVCVIGVTLRKVQWTHLQLISFAIAPVVLLIVHLLISDVGEQLQMSPLYVSLALHSKRYETRLK